MKKRTLVVLALVLSLGIIVTGSAMARQGGGYGKTGSGYDCGYDCGYGDCNRSDIDPEVIEQFRNETQPLKDELRALRQELREEKRKENPDAGRVAQLNEDMDGIQAKIQEIAGKYDIDCDGSGRRGSRGGKRNRSGGCRADCS